MKTADWTETALWDRLIGLGGSAETARDYVRNWLKDVQTLLAKAGTSPLNFTLHDDGHSYRVAQRMADLIPDETLNLLSDSELALLLLSAYLHDIGMNPNYDLVLKVRAFLLTGNSHLPPTEVERLQKWLDDTHPGMQPPVLEGLPDDERITEIELITAYYCRFRHNDWSEEFISEKAKKIPDPPYVLFLQDLILLCKSHHFGMQELMSQAFDLRLVGGSNRLVNLRYLAAVLRVADVLEFDPERTPEVIFARRAIPLSSKIFWHKDHSIALAISKKNFQVLITARTPDAWTHRAVLDTANDVDAELQTCANIKDQGGFSRGIRLDSADYYIWQWPPRSAHDISPIPGTFEYIDGAFRPDNRRILSLLAGNQLYATPLAAMRELLQNAFDAVKEQIALELLNDPNAHKIEVQEARARLHRVTLVLETQQDPKSKKEETCLICTDTGVGMTRRIIERHLLVGGSRPRPELLRLERLCRDKGIEFNRSGEFGIGVLSYFMLADKLILETMSSPEAYTDHEPHGWRFETEGLDAFGELKVAQGLRRGTKVGLRIPQLSMQAISSEADVQTYLRSLLAFLPCELSVSWRGCAMQWKPHWTKSIEEFKDEAFSFADPRHFYENRMRTREEKEDEEDRKRISVDALKKLRFMGPRAGWLPDKRGCYRIHLPYFELGDGQSLIFVALNADRENRFVSLASVLALSWRGFRVDNSSYYFGRSGFSVGMPVPCVVEIDLWKGAKIAVDRGHLKIDDAQLISDFVRKEIRHILEEFIEANSANPRYSSLAPIWAKLLPTESNSFKAFWVFESNKRKRKADYVWRKARLPALRGESNSFHSILNRRRDIAMPIKASTGPYLEDKIMPFAGLAASRLIVAGRHLFSCDCYLLYESIEHAAVDDAAIVEFPPEWRTILAIVGRELPPIFNKDHPTVKLTTFSLRAIFNEKIKSFGNEKILAEQQLKAREDCAAWLLCNVTKGPQEWKALIENFVGYLLKIFEDANVFQTEDTAEILRLQTDWPGFLFQISKTKLQIDSLRDLDRAKAKVQFPKDTKWLA